MVRVGNLKRQRAKRWWGPLFYILVYGYIAYLQGPQFFMVYGGLLVGVFSLQVSNDQSTQEQLDLLEEMARELDKQRCISSTDH